MRQQLFENIKVTILFCIYAFTNKMLREELKNIASALVSDGKGILAADETVEYMGKSLNSIGLENSEENRRLYKQLIFTTDKAENYISGIILLPETVYQKSDDGVSFLKLLKGKGILPGVNVDGGLVHLNGTDCETTTTGFDSLNELCKKYKKEGCCFAKWRCALKIGIHTPSLMAIKENANVLARYAVTCQANGLVPIVEPEVQLEGDHDLKKAQHVSELVLFHVYKALFEYGVYLEGTLLKPAMVMPGRSFSGKCTSDEIGKATVEVLSRTVPAAVPGIGFLSGGQTADEATENLLAINRHKGKMPWALTFIFGRALQESVASIWKGEKKNVARAQAELLRRAQVNSKATS